MSTSSAIAASELISRTRRVVSEVAARHAADVDLCGRFPAETLTAAREARLLSAAVPSELGGGGASMSQLAEMCFLLGQACGSSAMVLAMHHIQVALLVRHGWDVPALKSYLREIVEHQLLLASVTSEVGVGGDTRSSICAVERIDGRFILEKDATTISYGEHASGMLITCRRSPDASPGDQVLILLRNGDFKLGNPGSWDTMGMRGTCSPSFKVRCSGPEEQILPGSYADASAETMVPYSHILWASLWSGIAADAVARASAHVRSEARRKPGSTPPTATRLAEVFARLQAMRANVAATAADFDALGGERGPLGTMGWALRLNGLKVAASQSAPAIVHESLQIIGVMGYRNEGPFSVSRQYRDALSASLMVGNERILGKSAAMLLVFKDGGDA